MNFLVAFPLLVPLSFQELEEEQQEVQKLLQRTPKRLG
jgi:hypothetical protein